MTTYDIGHPAYKILAEIAEEAKWNPEPWREFEIYTPIDRVWVESGALGHALYVASVNPSYIRRRPRTVRVSGEIDQELWDKAKEWAYRTELGAPTPSDTLRLARALSSFTSREDEG